MLTILIRTKILFKSVINKFMALSLNVVIKFLI
nr:MAG TPA: hypothetical protein [Caudoviricetes sp.]